MKPSVGIISVLEAVVARLPLTTSSGIPVVNQARKIVYCPSEFTWDLVEALPKAYYYHVNGIPYEVYSKSELQPFYFFSQLKTSNHTPAFQKSEVYDFEGPEYITDEWLPPPLKSFYKVDIPFDKPTVVVNNKYSEEWKKPPENYLDLEDLDRIFSALKDRFNIIYIRAEGREKDYFNDDNKILDFGDFDFIDEKHSYVVSSRKLAKVYPELSFNTLQCVLLATSKRHISIAGGNAVLSSYFGGTNIVVCKCNVCISREIWSTDSYLTKLSGSKIVGLTNISSIENEIGAW